MLFNKFKKNKKPQIKVDKKSESLKEVIDRADNALLITSKHGSVEVRPIKNLNYSWQAKGLLYSTIDRYNIKSINDTVKIVTSEIMKNVIQLHNKTLKVLEGVTGNEKAEEKAS